MKEALTEFLRQLTGSPPLTVALISAFPLIELKGAIPVGEALGLGLFRSALLAYVGSTLVAVLLFLLLKPLFSLMKRLRFFAGLAERAEGVFTRRGEKLKRKGGGKRIIMWGVYAFVALPLPLTGVWTGTAVAVFLGLGLKDGILPVALGNLTAGAVITLLTYFLRDYVEYFILALFILAVIMLAVFIIKLALFKGDKK